MAADTPVGALDAIRSAARTLVDDYPILARRQRNVDALRAALDDYEDLLANWVKAMAAGEQYRADEPPPWVNPHRSGIDTRGIQ